MDENLVRNLLLVFCGLGAFILLIILYIWNFIFGRNLRAVLMAGLGILLNRDMTVDIDAPLDIKKRPKEVKAEMKSERQSLDFDGAMSVSDKYVPYIPGDEEEFGAQMVEGTVHKSDEFVQSSFEGGRFRKVANAILRPFQTMRLQPRSQERARNVNQGTDSNDSE